MTRDSKIATCNSVVRGFERYRLLTSLIFLATLALSSPSGPIE
jgi:hypothetical protein